MNDYNITVYPFYIIQCVNCEATTGWHNTEGGAEAHAELFGFITEETEDDDVLNFCKKCAKEFE